MNQSTKYIIRKEKTFVRRFQKIQQEYKKDFIESLGKEIKLKDDPLGKFSVKMAGALFDAYKLMVGPVMKRGFWDRKKALEKQIGEKVDFEIPTTDTDHYIDKIVKTAWFQSVPNTIHDELEKILREWIAEGQSYSQIAQAIQETDPIAFSPSRAKLWAVNEVWRAYGYADHLANQEFIRDGYNMEKVWRTQLDSKVRATHSQNFGDGWIPYGQPFSWTGEQFAPSRDYRCRCFMESRIVGKKG